MFVRLALLLFLSVCGDMWAILPLISGAMPRDMNIELQQPVYKDGVLSTDKGGVVKGKNLYLQAKKISYIKKQEGDKLTQTIEAEGDMLLTFKGGVYVGGRLEFDLDTQTGVIYDAVTSSDDWFISAKKMVIQTDGSATLYDCAMTTHEGVGDPWSIRSTEAHLNAGSRLKAKNVSFRIMELPVFWIPVFVTDLRTGIHTPLRYEVKYFGKHGPRLGLSYAFQVGDNWRNKVLLDISVTRGFGGGFETRYNNPNGKEQFSAFNYYAYDMRTTDSNRNNRYRFQGKYTNRIASDQIAVRASYDKLSDSNMPGDYINRGLDSGRAGPTELTLSHKEKNWISSLNTKARINTFQTVKQQLPLFQFSHRPMQLGQTGLILDNRFSAGYLDYKYARHVPGVHDFHSSRAEIRQSIYRGFTTNGFSITPRVGYRVIGYGNSPQHDAKLLALAFAGAECHTRFERSSTDLHQALEPYVQYDYVTQPTEKPPRHFLFDMEDGLYRQNMVRYGARHFLRLQQRADFISQLNFDLYARTFIHSPKVGSPTPRVYFDSAWKATPYANYFVKTAWDTERRKLDHFNARTELTMSENVALALEYRHRSAFSWRKVDPENFMIDTFRSQHSLKHSSMSDRRNTVLPHLFVRLSQNVAVEAISRHGWGRKHKPNYNEYEFNVITLVKGALNVTLNFQKRKEEYRYAIHFSFGAKKPSGSSGVRKLGQGNYDMP